MIGVGHAKQAQEPALELAQLGREDHGRPRPNPERVALHVVEQVDQSGVPWVGDACDPRG